jgi:hypothetical protein
VAPHDLHVQNKFERVGVVGMTDKDFTIPCDPTPEQEEHTEHGQTHTNAGERGGEKPRIATNDKMVPWPIGASSSKKLKLKDKIKALIS